MTNTAIQRTEIALLTNKSGGSVAQGDVVIVDSSNASAFTTTTSSAYVSGRIGVVIEPNGIANNSPGLVAFSGYVPVINLSGTGSIGDLVKTHTVAKQGVRHSSPQVAGDFAQVLGTSATPVALLFGTVQLGGGSGENVATSTIWDAKGDLAVGTGADTAEKLAVGANLKYVVADNTQATGLLWVTGGRILISSPAFSGGTFTFSSIPGTYSFLELIIFGRSDKAASNYEDVLMEANGDTTPANYKYILGQAYASANVGAASGDDRFIARLPAASAPTNSAGMARILIPYYATTTFFKQASGIESFRHDNSSLHEIVASRGWEWESQNAITQLVVKLGSGNYVTGTTAALYGLP